MKCTKPNMSILVIHITYKCNGFCDNCSNLVFQAPSSEEMSLQSIENFVNDSIINNYKWRKIVLQGGEPTLHPQFKEICQLLKNYKDNHNNTVCLAICTNGYSQKTKELLQFASEMGYLLENSNKSSEIMKKHFKYSYVPINCAPIDFNYNIDTIGCFQSSECGITLNNQGYWECSPAASSVRVFDFFKPICTEIKDLTEENTIKKFFEHCHYCGFLIEKQHGRVVEQTTSKTWEEYLKKYNNQ